MPMRLPGPRTPFGHALWGVRTLVGDRYETLVRLRDRYGDIVEVGRWPLRFVFVFGRDANELVLATDADAFTWREAFASLIPVDGDTALVVTDGDEHARRRRLVQPAFAIRKVRSYAPIALDETTRSAATWSPGDRINLYDELRKTVRRIAIRSLFGDRLRDRADELGDRLQAAINFANLPPLPGRDVDLPGTPHRRAMRARAGADEIIFDEIARRRASGDTGDDLLGSLLDAQDDDGSTLTDQEVRDQVVSLIAAGYDTTSALVAWALYAVLRDQVVEQRLRTELGDAGTDVDAIDANRYLDAVISESLRLHSPASVAGRMAQRPVEFRGHTIPPKRFVIYSQYVTHRDPTSWPNPRRFDPDRWLAADGGAVEPPPYSFVPFGGGYRRCIGFALATLEAKVVVAECLRQHTFRLERQDIRGTGVVSYAPKGGVPVTVLT